MFLKKFLQYKEYCLFQKWEILEILNFVYSIFKSKIITQWTGIRLIKKNYFYHRKSKLKIEYFTDNFKLRLHIIYFFCVSFQHCFQKNMLLIYSLFVITLIIFLWNPIQSCKQLLSSNCANVRWVRIIGLQLIGS